MFEYLSRKKWYTINRSIFEKGILRYISELRVNFMLKYLSGNKDIKKIDIIFKIAKIFVKMDSLFPSSSKGWYLNAVELENCQKNCSISSTFYKN